VDSAIDAVGFEAKGHSGEGRAATVLNQMMEITRPAGEIGIPGLYVTSDPGATTEEEKKGSLSLRFGEGWSKAHGFHTGQTPTLRYNRALMQAIWYGRVNIAEIVNATIMPLEDAAKGYEAFDSGAASKFVLDPHGLLAKAA
jgi:glutathione-independent formaldehyde dehydrogenase